MLEDLRIYNNLGTLAFFLELFSLFLKKDSWKLSDLKAHFYNRVIDGQYIFDWWIPLLLQLRVLVESNKNISMNPAYSKMYSLDSEELKKELIEIMFNSKIFEDYFIYLFSPWFITINTLEWNILINNNAFELQYSNIKQLLINLDFINKPTWFELGSYILNNAYHNLIIKNWLPRKAKRIIDLQQLEKQLETNDAYWREAEEFVLFFEKKRTGKNTEIIHVSEIDVCAWFDILSFHNKGDSIAKRLIEVKSYSWNPHFHWSRNEIEKAKEAWDDYCIYLVNREELYENDYSPLIIESPYLNIFKSNNWSKNVESYFVSKI